MSKPLQVLRELLFPPRCAGCHRLLPLFETQGSIFCDDCAMQWEREMRLQCPRCYGPYYECRCQPRVMKRAGCTSLLKLAPYGEGTTYRVVHRMVLDMKRRPSSRVTQYLAKELAPSVLEELKETGVSAQNAVIAYLPRHPRKYRREGTDQARELAVALGDCMQISFSDLIARHGRSREQKKLNAKQRAENLKGEFFLRGEVDGRLVILVDDLVTTGTGMSLITRLLLQAGASGVLAVAIAYTERKMRE